MTLSTSTYLFLTAAGFLAGLVDSMAGGGGLISLPALLAAGVPVHLALGSNKLQSCLGTSFSTARFLKGGHVTLKVAIPAALMALVGSAAGSRVALAVSSQFLSGLIPPMIILVGVITFVRKNFGSDDHFGEAAGWHSAVSGAIGLVIGFYDGFFGPGTGTFLVFLFVAFLGFGFLRANANAKVVNLGSNVAAVISFAISGKILIIPALLMGVANIAGNLIGAGLAIKQGSRIIKPVFGLVLAALLVKIVLSR